MKKKIVGIFVVMLLIGTVLPISAQLKSNENEKDFQTNHLNGGWYKTYGGDGIDGFKGIELTSDGAYILSGETEIDGNKDAWILKIDTNGEIIWETTYGTTNGWDGFWPLIETTDGGYLAGGWFSNNTNGYTIEKKYFDALLVKTDENGNIAWANTYGGDKKDEFFSILETDTGYLALGITKSYSSAAQDGFLVKTDFDGNMIWFKIIEKEGYSCGFSSIIAANDANGYILSGGHHSSTEPAQGRLVKIDEEGNILWDKSYGTLLFQDWCPTVTKTQDNNYIISGYTMGGPFGLIIGLWGPDGWLMKLDNNGNIIWEQRHGVPFFKDYSLCVQPTIDNGFIFTGHTMGIGKFGDPGFAALSKMWLVKTDADGNIEWEKRMPGDGHCRTVREIPDGYTLCGYLGEGHVANSEHAILIKTDKNGNID